MAMDGAVPIKAAIENGEEVLWAANLFGGICGAGYFIWEFLLHAIQG